MPAPTPLAIATSSLQRLVKEQASYHKELQQQQKRIEKTEKKSSTDEEEEEEEERGNLAFQLQQERRALDETRAVFPGLQDRITSATEKLESLLESGQSSDEVEVKKAEKAVAEAKAVQS